MRDPGAEGRSTDLGEVSDGDAERVEAGCGDVGAASVPASAYIAAGLAWSMKRSGRVIVRMRRPAVEAAVGGEPVQHPRAEPALGALLDGDERAGGGGSAGRSARCRAAWRSARRRRSPIRRAWRAAGRPRDIPARCAPKLRMATPRPLAARRGPGRSRAPAARPARPRRSPRREGSGRRSALRRGRRRCGPCGPARPRRWRPSP